MQDLPTASSLQDQSSSSGFRDRDVSPDSVIFTADSNFSLFSSTSASVDRCSFASDIHDQEDSVVSGISQVCMDSLHDICSPLNSFLGLENENGFLVSCQCVIIFLFWGSGKFVL